MNNIFIWILILYLLPASLCTWLSYFLSTRVNNTPHRRKILLSGLTLSWAPGVITGGHGGYFGQMLIGLILFLPGRVNAEFFVFNSILIAITFLIVWCVVWAFNLGK